MRMRSEDSLAKMPENEIKIGEATAVRFAKFECSGVDKESTYSNTPFVHKLSSFRNREIN